MTKVTVSLKLQESFSADADEELEEDIEEHLFLGAHESQMKRKDTA